MNNYEMLTKEYYFTAIKNYMKSAEWYGCCF